MKANVDQHRLFFKDLCLLSSATEDPAHEKSCRNNEAHERSRLIHFRKRIFRRDTETEGPGNSCLCVYI